MTPAPPDRPRGGLRRKLGMAARLVAALALAGGVYTAFAPASQAQDTTDQMSAAAQRGKQLYDTSCISCHGRNAEGVAGRGPSLIGVGSAAVEFQVTTGRMPLNQQGPQADRKTPKFSDAQAKQLGQYIQALGGGPQVPDGDLRQNADLANGGELYRVNCSACHGFTGHGGALSSGKYAPGLQESTDRQIYAAMLSGPENMPVFGDNELTPQEKMDIIAYVQNMKSDQSPGGWSIGAIGPVTEGLVIFLVGITALLFATLWIAGKS